MIGLAEGRALERVLRGLAVGCGLVAALVALFLIGDELAEWRRAARESATVTRLEERTVTDAEAAAELEVERQRITERSVARDRRNRRLAWVLLVAAAAFLAAAKSLQALTRDPRRAAPGEAPLVALGTSRVPTVRSATSGPSAPSVDLAFVDDAIGRHGTGREATIPILQALQAHYRYLPEAALRRVCERTELTPADLVGVATFYSQFRRAPVGRHLVRICHGTACHVAGIDAITDELRRRLEIPAAGDSDAEMRFTLDPVNCLGCCSLAPVLMVDDQVAGRLTPARAFEVLAAAEGEG